jgi:mono/diheme cytochrome c family protein
MRWQLRAVGALVACVLVGGGVGASHLSAQEADGAALYKRNCRSCHGSEGVPSARMLSLYPKLKSFADSAYLATLSVDSIVAITRTGVGDMKPYADKLSPAEMEAIAQYVRTLASAPATKP